MIAKFEESEDKLKQYRQERLNKSLIDACQHGLLDDVKILLTSENLDMHADICGKTGEVLHYNLKFPLSAACKDGHLEIVKYLLTSSELKQHADIKQERYHAVFEACMYGWFDIVKYFLTSPDLKEHASIHIVGHEEISLLNEAATRGRVEIVRFLMESPELEQHPNIHEEQDFAFKVGLIYNTEEHRDLIKYLIFDLKIEKTEHIKKHLKEFPNLEAEKWFEMRDLNQSLEKELDSDKIKRNKQTKI